MTSPATPADLDAVTEIELACFGPDAWSSGLVQETLRAGRHTVLTAGPDAYAAISVAGDTADLDRIAVMPSRRRQGVARRLLDALVGTAREQGATRMLLEVAADNDAAVALYAAYGFATINRRSRYYRSGSDALVMQLDLEEKR